MIEPHHRGLIFDCDGTIADSMPVHWLAWSAALKHHGLDHLMPYDRFMAWGGVPAETIFGILADEAGIEIDARAAAEDKYNRYFTMADQIQPIEPIMAIVYEYQGKLPMAVATGSTRAGIDRTLKQINATHLFDAVVCADDVENAKPAPDTFLEAARRIGVEPTHCLAFEDAGPGIESAKAAGMQVIDVRDVPGVVQPAPEASG
jgi:HAD superfamily hydrolase (TIGR01509 family)